MLLALVADEEADQSLAGGDRDRRAGERDRRHHRPADGARPRLDRGGGDQLAGGEEGGRPQQGAARVDVVLGLGAAGERHLADHERVLAQLGEQGAPGGLEVGHGRNPRAERGFSRAPPGSPGASSGSRGCQPSSRFAFALEAPRRSDAELDRQPGRRRGARARPAPASAAWRRRASA